MAKGNGWAIALTVFDDRWTLTKTGVPTKVVGELFPSDTHIYESKWHAVFFGIPPMLLALEPHVRVCMQASDSWTIEAVPVVCIVTKE